MALQTLSGGGFWLPGGYPDLHVTGTGLYTIDATGEQVALVIRAPKTGNIDRFDAYIQSVNNAADNGLRFSIQGVSGTTGLPSGTILGATNNALVSYPTAQTTGWKLTNFGEVVAVTRNQLIALVIDIPSFTAGDSIEIRGIAGNAQNFEMAFPYGISSTATHNQQLMPLMALHYTDGYAVLSQQIPAMTAEGTVAYNVSDGTADEWGMGFQVPFPCQLNGVLVPLNVTAGGDFEVLVYDSTDAVLATLAHDGDVLSFNAATKWFHLVTQTALTLSANATYRVTVRPTTANNVTLLYMTFNTAALMGTMAGGSAFYMTSRKDQAGSWTDYNSGTFRRPFMGLEFSGFDDAASAGGNAILAGTGEGLVIS